MKVLSAVLVLFGVLSPLQAAEHNPLLPRPQQVQYGSGQIAIGGLSIRLPKEATVEDRFAANSLTTCLSQHSEFTISVSESGAAGRSIDLLRSGAVGALPVPGEQAGPESRESYSLKIGANGVELRAVSTAGLFYGAQTLCQLAEGTGPSAVLPEVEIHDWPSLPFRGVMIDTSHGPLPTEAEVKRQLDFLARWKNNQYYLYSEASIALDGFPIQSSDAQFSQDAIRRIVAYARERHIDVVPCMELNGHLHDLFRVERYSGLSLLPHGRDFDPRNPQVAPLMRSWVDQLTDLFPSQFFHIGFDETWEAPALAGNDKSLPAKLYMQQFRLVSDLVRGHGKTLLVWSDMFSKYPNLIPEIPPGTIIVPWGYDRTVYRPYWKPFEDSPLPRFVATGVSVWDYVAPNFDRSFDNIDSFLAAGRQHGVTGLINTVWTDDIAVLLRPAFPGMAYGAVAAWQSGPVNRETFFVEYARILYGPAAASEAALGLAALNHSEVTFAKAVGGEEEQTSPSFWDDPLKPVHLARAQEQAESFRQTRLLAEEAIEHFSKAMWQVGDSSTLSDLQLEGRLLDYAAMKNVYAAEIAGFWRELGSHPDPDKLGFYLTEISSHDHSLIQDLMDYSGELREAYRAAWLDSYTPYRLGTVMGKWDSEFEHWWKLQRRFRNLDSSFHSGDTLPPLETLSPEY